MARGWSPVGEKSLERMKGCWVGVIIVDGSYDASSLTQKFNCGHPYVKSLEPSRSNPTWA
jgi:hypothetical protein